MAKTSPLREKMIRDLTIRGRSQRTMDSYVRTAYDLARYHMRSPDQLSPSEIEDYLYSLIEDRHLALGSVNVAGHALRFLYYVTLGRDSAKFHIPIAKKPKKLPVIFSQQEIPIFVQSASSLKNMALLMATYAAGLRVSEVVQLKVGDIDSSRMVVEVRDGKGGKDRYIGLSDRLLTTLRKYWKVYRPSYWLFPSRIFPTRPLSRAGAQYIFKQALADSGIGKKCSIHSLRHSFATHLVEAGKDIRTVQRLLGHKSLSSTMIYIHIAQGKLLSTDSPLDLLDWEEKE